MNTIGITARAVPYVKNNMEKCKCYPKNSDYPTYCPVHDGDYGKWKYGENYEDWDEKNED